MSGKEKIMYNYHLLENSSEIEKAFMNSFIDTIEYDNFAVTHANGDVHMFDFIKESRKVFYGEIVKLVEDSSIDTYYIMLNISQCYCERDKTLKHDYKTAEVSRENLLVMLKDQMEDMRGEELCCVKNSDRTNYWDMMIFDCTCTWCVAITHEDDTNGNRLCFAACPKELNNG